MNPLPTQEQHRLFNELVLPGQHGKRIKRINVRRLFRDSRFTTLRRYIMACSLVATQAREGVDISFDHAYSLQS
jgi:hypothetical protein